MAEKIIQNLIEQARQLSEAECDSGTFALAAAKHLSEAGHRCSLGIIYKELIPPALSLSELAASKTEVYHVVLEHEGRFYDRSGEVTSDDLLERALYGHNDASPGFFHEVAHYDRNQARLIEGMGYQTSVADFMSGFLIEDVVTLNEGVVAGYENDDETLRRQRERGFLADSPHPDPRGEKLKEILLPHGGYAVVVDASDPDLDALLAHGEIIDAPAKFHQMEPINCHDNAAEYADEHGCEIQTGYALSEDGMWRCHSWAFHDGHIIETTVPREMYWGITLSPNLNQLTEGVFAKAVDGLGTDVVILRNPGRGEINNLLTQSQDVRMTITAPNEVFMWDGMDFDHSDLEDQFGITGTCAHLRQDRVELDNFHYRDDAEYLEGWVADIHGNKTLQRYFGQRPPIDYGLETIDGGPITEGKKKKKGSAPKPKKGAGWSIATSDIFEESLERHSKVFPDLREKLAKFVEVKLPNPLQNRYGKHDRACTAALSGFYHCHLRDDAVLLYYLEGRSIVLTAIVSHAEIEGKRLKKTAKKLHSVKESADTVTLYHGTCDDSAETLMRDGWAPDGGEAGANQGQNRYLYLSTGKEDAMWFAHEKGCDTVLTVRVPIDALEVDPEDGIADTVEEEMSSPMGLPGKLVLTRAVGPEAFGCDDAPMD